MSGPGIAAISSATSIARALNDPSASSRETAVAIADWLASAGSSASPTPRSATGLGVEKLVGCLRQAELGNAAAERTEERARPGVGCDHIAAGEDTGLGDVAFDADMARLRAERVRVARWADGDQYLRSGGTP
jgi:hypothetical protein